MALMVDPLTNGARMALMVDPLTNVPLRNKSFNI